MTKDRRKIESILREPLARHRLLLNNHLRAAQNPENENPFSFDDLRDFISKIPSRDADFIKEAQNVIDALTTGVAPRPPKFETPETQLIWGAALAFLTINPEHMLQWKTPVENGYVQGTELWKQITGTKRAYQELLTHAHHVREALRDKDTKYGWGEPGSGFTFQRNKNVINIDLMQSLIVGFEHARADVYREVGLSLLSVTYPRRMQELFKEMRPLMQKAQQAQGKGKGKKGKGPKLKPEEYKQLMMLQTEWELRHMMFAAAEENVTNRFVSNMGRQMLQDFSVSLNNTAVTFRGMGLTRIPGKDDASEELRRYMNLCNAVQLSFFQNNSLFENTDSGWGKVGINPNLVRKTATLKSRPDDKKDDNDGIAHPDFQHLRELCGGPDGLENLQPKAHERLFGWRNMQNRIARCDADRKAVIEEIWKLFGEELIQNILKHANDQLDEQLEKAKQDQQDQDQDQDGDENDQDGDDGQENEGGGSPQKGQKGQKGKKGKKQRGTPQGDMSDDMDEDGDDADQDGQDQDGQDQDGQDQKGKKDKNQKDKKDKGDKSKGDKGEKGEEQDGEDQDGQGDGEDQDGQDQDGQDGDQQGAGKEGKLGQDDDETVPVEGAGDMPAPKSSSEIPADEQDPSNGQDGEGQDADGQDADGQDADGQDADGDDADGAMTEEQLEDKVSDMDGQDADGDEADGQDADGDEADGQQQGKKKVKSKKPSKQAGSSDGKLEDLSKKDWREYNKRIAELAGPINRVRKLFKDVQERQLQRKQVTSRTLDIIPENSEVKERFNAEAHRNMAVKKASGQLEENDLKRFHKDEPKFTPTEIDIVIMIDGSGSMKGRPLDSALQAGAIMFEAASGKDMNMNVYVGIWGNDDPPIIIRPGADRIQIGQAMEAARPGLSSGTDLAPAIRKVAQVIAEQRGKSGTMSGFTHVLIVSDGDINSYGGDAEEARKRMQDLFTYADKVTFDVAIIGRQGTAMEQTAKKVKGHKPYHDVGITIGSDGNTIPLEIVGLLLDKVRKCGSFIAVPNTQKRRAMQKALNKMDKKR